MSHTEPPKVGRWRKMTSDDTMHRHWPCDQKCPKEAIFLYEEGEGNTRHVLAYRCLDHMDLEAMAKLANDAFGSLSPEAQKKHRRDQAVSWVYGQLRLDGVEVSEEQVIKVIDGMGTYK